MTKSKSISKVGALFSTCIYGILTLNYVVLIASFLTLLLILLLNPRKNDVKKKTEKNLFIIINYYLCIFKNTPCVSQ